MPTAYSVKTQTCQCSATKIRVATFSQSGTNPLLLALLRPLPFPTRPVPFPVPCHPHFSSIPSLFALSWPSSPFPGPFSKARTFAVLCWRNFTVPFQASPLLHIWTPPLGHRQRLIQKIVLVVHIWRESRSPKLSNEVGSGRVTPPNWLFSLSSVVI